MSIKYDEVNQQILLRSRQNDDVIMETLNLFAIFLNSGDYQPYEEMFEVKEKLNAAFQEYENLLSHFHPKGYLVNSEVDEKYKQLIDRNRDNLEA